MVVETDPINSLLSPFISICGEVSCYFLQSLNRQTVFPESRKRHTGTVHSTEINHSSRGASLSHKNALMVLWMILQQCSAKVHLYLGSVFSTSPRPFGFIRQTAKNSLKKSLLSRGWRKLERTLRVSVLFAGPNISNTSWQDVLHMLSCITWNLIHFSLNTCAHYSPRIINIKSKLYK